MQRGGYYDLIMSVPDTQLVSDSYEVLARKGYDTSYLSYQDSLDDLRKFGQLSIQDDLDNSDKAFSWLANLPEARRFRLYNLYKAAYDWINRRVDYGEYSATATGKRHATETLASLWPHSYQLVTAGTIDPRPYANFTTPVIASESLAEDKIYDYYSLSQYDNEIAQMDSMIQSLSEADASPAVIDVLQLQARLIHALINKVTQHWSEVVIGIKLLLT